MAIIGIDIGNVFVKTSKLIHFPSKTSSHVAFENSYLMEYEGEEMLIGDGELSTDLNKTLKPNLLPLLYAAIYRSTTDTGNKVVLGLPISQVKQHKDDLKELILRNNRKNVNGRIITITDVEVVGEAITTYYNLSKEDKEKIGIRPLLIIDIGGRTIDITSLEFKSGKWTATSYKTIPFGILNLYADVINHVNEAYTVNFDLEEAEDIIASGLFINGKYEDVSFIKPIVKNYFDSLMKDINLAFNTSKGYMYLTGGGNKIFRPAFSNRFNNLIVSSNPFFDNSVGYEKVGNELWLKK